MLSQACSEKYRKLAFCIRFYIILRTEIIIPKQFLRVNGSHLYEIDFFLHSRRFFVIDNKTINNCAIGYRNFLGVTLFEQMDSYLGNQHCSRNQLSTLAHSSFIKEMLTNQIFINNLPHSTLQTKITTS